MELTPKQEQVLFLVSRGCKDREVAKVLGISERTVQNHLRKIYAKTCTTSRIEAVVLYVTSRVCVVKRRKNKRKQPVSTGKMKEMKGF